MSQKGQGLVEYALILVLIAIIVIAMMMILEPIAPGFGIFVVNNWGWLLGALIVAFGFNEFLKSNAKSKTDQKTTEKKDGSSGQGLVEYALILVLVAIVVIAALMVLGPVLEPLWPSIVRFFVQSFIHFWWVYALGATLIFGIFVGLVKWLNK